MSLDNGAASSACSPVLARSPDTTTATPTAGDVNDEEDDEDEEDEDEDGNHSSSPEDHSIVGTKTPKVANEVVQNQAGSSPAQLGKKPETKLQVSSLLDTDLLAKYT